MLPRLIFIIFIIENQIVAEKRAVLSSQVLADETSQAKELQKQADKLVSERLFSNIEGPKLNKGCVSNQLDEKKPKCGLQKLPTSQKKAGQILVFISFSMPKITLQSLAQEAQNHNAVLVMRGLYQDSFAKTAYRLQELGVTVDINPELFEKHHITSVPTFLFIKNSHSVYRLKGNVTLEFVAKKFEDQGIKEVPCASLIP